MDMVKYIVKRLLLSVLILFGVSIIIYALARMMPTDYVDQQYSSAVSQGTMRQEDVDRIKDLYGLSMPDAYLSVKAGEGSQFSGTTFTKNAKSEKRDVDLELLLKEDARVAAQLSRTDLTDAERAEFERQKAENDASLEAFYLEWYIGKYDHGSNRIELSRQTDAETGAYRYVYRIGTVTEKGAKVDGTESDEEGKDNSYIALDEVFTEKESGTWTLGETDGNGIRQIVLTSKDGASVASTTVYRVAGFWDQVGAILKGYFGWLFNMLQGDFGMSFKYKKPVKDVIFQNMGISFAIAFVATILQFAIAIPLGIKAATHQYGVIDYGVTVTSMIGISLPTFFLAALVIRLFAVQLGWFEVGGIASSSLPMDASWIQRLGDNLWHMVLPMFVLVVLSIGSLMRYTRTNTLEALNADYVRTARAKGLPERKVINKHAFRNTMIPLVTLMAGILPSLFGGAMITETVFSIPGIGKLAYDALIVADVPFIMGYNVFIAVLTVIGTLLSDLMYAIVDPRVKLGR